jgi:hypothetical protein
MTVIAVGAAKGAPGVTTTVLALATRWPQHREPLVVEADPAGGDLVARLASLTADDSALRESPSTVQLAAVSRSGLTTRRLLEHLQRLPGPGEVRALIAPSGPFAATTAIEALTTGGLGRCLSELHEMDSLVDVGRIDPGSPALPLIRAADQFVLVVRPSLESVVHTRDLWSSMRSTGVQASVVVVGDRPYAPVEVADAIAADDLLGVLPEDPVGAAALAGNARSPKILARTRLVRAADDIASRLVPLPPIANDPQLPPPPERVRRFDVSTEATR